MTNGAPIGKKDVPSCNEVGKPSGSPTTLPIPNGSRPKNLAEAVRFNRSEWFEYGLQEGWGVDVQDELGNTPLHYAACYRNTQQLERLLSMGADPNCRNNQGQGVPPLAFALVVQNDGWVPPSAGGSMEDVVKRLLEAGADTAWCNEAGKSLLRLTIEQRQSIEVLQRLMDHGANPNQADPEGRTPVHRAAYQGDACILALLIGGGGNLNAFDRRGRSVLWFAVQGWNASLFERVKFKLDEHRDMSVIELLLHHGANPHAGVEETAWKASQAKGKEDVWALFQKHEAQTLRSSVGEINGNVPRACAPRL